MSNRLTFSLASLVLIFAFGLVFSAAPVFAQATIVTDGVEFTSTGPYKLGSKVTVAVTFSESVTVTAATDNDKPSIPIDGTDGAVYKSGSPGTRLIFEGTVNAGSDISGGLAIAANSLRPNGNGTINDTATPTNAAVLAHTAVTANPAQAVDVTSPVYAYAANTNPLIVSSSPYNIGDEIEVTLTFTETQGMAEKGVIPFQIGNGANPDRFLEVSASTTTTVTFSYTVQSGDSGLARIEAQKVPRSIMDLAGNVVSADQDLLANSTTATLDLGNVSTVQPTVSAVAITSTGPYTDTTGDAIEVTVTFSEKVAVTGTPQITLTIGTGTAEADYDSISADNTELMFSHPIVTADAGDVSIAANALALNGGSINATNAFANRANLDHDAVATSANQTVDSAAPTVTNVAITSKAGVTGPIYVTGDKITATLTFSEDVTVTGIPTLTLVLALGTTSMDRTATYESGTGTDELVFSYTVAAADVADAVSVKANGLAVGTGITIKDAVDHDATLSNTSASQTAIVNPTTIPAVTVAADATTANKFTIGFDEVLKAGSFTVADLDIKNGTAAAADLVKDTTPATGSVESYTLTVTADASYELVTVQVKKDSVENMYGNKGPAAVSPTPPVVSLDKIGPAVRIETDPTVGMGGPAGNQDANGPPQLESDGTAKFKITFTEELGIGVNGLQYHDLKITGGSATDAAITGPADSTDDAQADDDYELLVTPKIATTDIVPGLNPSPADITVEFDLPVGPQIRDTNGNDIDLTTAVRYMSPLNGTKSATFDRTPPLGIVTHESGPDAAGKLVFKVVFSEPVRDPSVFDRGATANLSVNVGDGVTPVGTDKTTYNIQVTSNDLTKPTTILFPAASVGSVTDLVGHPIAADAVGTYTPPVSNTAPSFPANAKPLNLPEGLCKDDTLPALKDADDNYLNVILPLAIDTEGDTLTYSLTGGTSATRTIPNASRTAGFYWETIDTQTRVLKGKATLADDGTYTWTVTDSHGAMATTEFSIIVKDHQVPAKPTGLQASKVEADSMVSPTKNRVRLTWAAPRDLSAYPNCIPAVTDYIVTQRKFDRLAGTFGSSTTHTVPSADVEFDLPELPTGIYDFTIKAGNSVGHSVASDAAVWDVTTGTRVVVANPPASPTDLDATINSRSVTLDWLKVPDAQDGGAPIHDDAIAGDAKLTKVRSDFYGAGVTGDYAGYVVYQTNEKTAAVTRYPETGTLTTISADSTTPFNYTHPAFQVTGLTAGEYTFRVVAKNIAGESPDSDTATKRVVIVADPQNQAPAFAADAKIDNIVATVGKAISGVILPEATDPEGDTLTYEIDPDVSDIGLDFDDETRALTGTPDKAAAETVYTYTVTDDNGGEDTITFLITVNAAVDPTNAAPAFAADAKIDNIVATVGKAISGVILPEATDPDSDDTLTYSIDPDVSDIGLDFDATTRALTGTPDKAAAETVYTYTVTDRATGGKSDTISFFITVNSVTAGPGTGTPTTELPAKGYVVYVRSLTNAPVFGTASPMVAEWSAMPNLHQLFAEGGGGSLQLNVTGVDARQVVMSEVMWAVDEGKVGQDSYDGQQWIEVHNRTDNAIDISNISFSTKSGRPALAQGTDLISNVVGAGNDWIKAGKGQNGNSTAGSLKEFRSMFRNNYGEAGWDAGRWTESTAVYHPNHKGTPGKGEPKGPKSFAPSGVALGTVFNEIANYASGNSSHEWIELRKKGGELNNLENWVVDMVTGVDAQTRLFKIPKLNDGRYGEVLLITKTDPARDNNHPLRGGYDVTKDIGQQDNEGRDKNIRYYVASDWNTDLPDNGEFVLILRHGSDKTNHEKVEDLAGYHPNLKVETADFFTNLWPLIGYAAPNLSHNKINSGAVHRRAFDDIPGTKTKDGNKTDKVAFQETGWTGIGYKRNADAGNQNGGTPGYPNNALQGSDTPASADSVVISEIMYSTGDRGNLPQWIELRNMSKTAGVNLDGWRLTIVNHDKDNADDTYPGDLVKSYNVNGKIPPGQTFLVVAHSGTDNTNLPSERIVSIGTRRGDVIMSQYGFEITLENKDNSGREVADKVGNLAMASADARVRGNPQSYETPAWMLPAGIDANGDRVSIVRVSTNGTLENGLDQQAWKSFDMSVHINAPQSTYYGNRNDLASPGYTVDGVLPVELSKFRPERQDDGSVVIRWITQSEKDNAGFNILRGEALDSEFTKLNTQLIAGQGTTSERTAYEFVDKSAKPNVVYYYQIQDVSLDGDVATLRITHLRGNISAAGKLATTWGELKALQ